MQRRNSLDLVLATSLPVRQRPCGAVLAARCACCDTRPRPNGTRSPVELQQIRLPRGPAVPETAPRSSRGRANVRDSKTDLPASGYAPGALHTPMASLLCKHRPTTLLASSWRAPSSRSCRHLAAGRVQAVAAPLPCPGCPSSAQPHCKVCNCDASLPLLGASSSWQLGEHCRMCGFASEGQATAAQYPMCLWAHPSQPSALGRPHLGPSNPFPSFLEP